jgi:hypothetical protein
MVSKVKQVKVMRNNIETLEEILTQETRKLVGYIMPVLEAMEATDNQRQSIKKILWTFKENLSQKLNQAQELNDKSNFHQ